MNIRNLGKFVASTHFRAMALLVILGSLPTSARLVDALGDFDGSSDPDTILAKLPQKLSLTGLYDNVTSKSRKVTAGIVAFEVNSPLWSDASFKERFITLPLGGKVTPTDTTGYQFPDKTILVKNFLMDTVYGDTTTRIYIETRFLILHPDSFPSVIGLSYKWRRDQSDADLIEPGAGLDDVQTLVKNGAPIGKQWRYPSRTDCMTCHKGHQVLGFITPQLNRPSKENPSINQLAALVSANILTTNPLTTSANPTFRWVGLKETNVTPPAGISLLEWKSRSYLAANCAHCHGDRTPAEGASHSFDFLKPNSTHTVFDSVVANSLGYISKKTGREAEFPQVLYKGYPESSYVVRRMMARTYGIQMPPLATYQMDSNAVTTIKDWICSMGTRGAACQLPAGQPSDDSYWTTGLRGHVSMVSRSQPLQMSLRGQWLVIPGYLGGTVTLHDARGRVMPMSSLGGGRFQLLAPIRAGLYFVKNERGISPVQDIPYPSDPNQSD